MAISPGGRPADDSPLGKKGGPRGLSDYVREVAHALIRRGVPESRAIAIARSQQAKWAVKSKNPAIRAASASSLAEQHVLDHRKKGKRDLSNKTPRPGSIPSGSGKGKFPITDQHSVDAASHLIGRAKGVSKKKIKAHVIAEAKRRGLKLPATWQQKDMSRAFDTGGAASWIGDLSWQAFDAARPKGQPRQAKAQPATTGQPYQPDLLSAQTHKNIAAYQKAHGLPADGQLNAATVAYLNSAKSKGAGSGSSAADKAAKKAAKAKAAATKKAARLKAAAAKKAARVRAGQVARANKAKAKAAAASQKTALAYAKGHVGVGAPVRTVSMAVPVKGADGKVRFVDYVASNDGARMTSKQPFGGKKAAPFVKGGGRAKNAKMLKAEMVRREMMKRKAVTK